MVRVQTSNFLMSHTKIFLLDQGGKFLMSMHTLLLLGLVAKFGVTVGKMDWLQDRSSWSLASLDGKDLDNFDYVVATDKNVGSPRFSGLTGRPPPLGLFYNLHNVNQHEIRFNSVQYYNLRHLVLEGKLLVSR